MKKTIVSLSDLLKANDMRNDATYWVNKNQNGEISFTDIFKCCTPIPLMYEDLEEVISYCQIGDLKNTGEILPTEINLSSITDPTDDNAPIHKKMFNLNGEQIKCKDMMPVEPGDILIAKTRPMLNKVLLIEQNEYLDNSQYYYTKAFLRVRMKDEQIDPVVGYYIIKHLLNQELIAISRIGKSGYPTINMNDLYCVKINDDIGLLRDSDFNEKIKSIHNDGLKIRYELQERLKQNSEKLKEALKH